MQSPKRLMLALISILCICVLSSPILAQSSSTVDPITGAVQVINGYIETGTGDIYELNNLSQGDVLYVYVKGTSGNLDPFIGLGNSDLNISNILTYFKERMKQNLAEKRDPWQAYTETADKFFLKWDDDNSAGYDSSLEYEIRKDGNYKLLVSNSPLSHTFGDYRMLIGLGSPQVLNDDPEQESNIKIAILKNHGYNESMDIQEINGTIDINEPVTIMHLNRIFANDTLFALVEARSSNLTPIIILKDFGNKTLAVGNWAGTDSNATFKYLFKNDSENNYLRIYSGSDGNGEITSGDYRLILGINAPEVLSGKAKPGGKSIVSKPINVNCAIELEQITGVDQKQADFSVIASLWMTWVDPALAFSPESCQCDHKTFNNIDDFVKAEGERFPIYTFRNAKEDISTESEIMAVNPEGSAIYFRRFAATFSAPDLDLRQYPFDIQKFLIEIDSIYPDRKYDFIDSNKSGAKDNLGNEEWKVVGTFTNTTTIAMPMVGTVHSGFLFNFLAKRHIDYYIYRIIIPILIIITLTWLTFFLHKDYIKRIEIVGANLLLFIAYNFTIAGDLPKLGYLTLMDRIIVSTFTMTAVIFAYNVYLRWLDMHGKKELAERLDMHMIWLYPLAYIGGLIIFVAAYDVVYRI